MSEENSPENTPPNALQRMFQLLAYLAGIGLLLFIVFVILFSLWSIIKTA